MANTFTTTANNSSASAAPTGKVNIINGISNISKAKCKANQQILVGDPVFQNNASNVFTALPAVCASVVGDTSNAASNNALRLGIAANFLGFATTYRSPKNTSSGKNSDVISVATGRARIPVNPANATALGNETGVGTFWGIACTQNNQYNGTATPLANNSWVLLGSDGQPVYEPVTAYNHAIGRQALPREAGDTYVTVDTFSTLLGPGVTANPT